MRNWYSNQDLKVACADVELRLVWRVQEHNEVRVAGSGEEDEWGVGPEEIFSEKGAPGGLGQGWGTCDVRTDCSGARAEVGAPLSRIQMHVLPSDTSVLCINTYTLIASLWQIRAWQMQNSSLCFLVIHMLPFPLKLNPHVKSTCICSSWCTKELTYHVLIWWWSVRQPEEKNINYCVVIPPLVLFFLAAWADGFLNQCKKWSREWFRLTTR